VAGRAPCGVGVRCGPGRGVHRRFRRAVRLPGGRCCGDGLGRHGGSGREPDRQCDQRVRQPPGSVVSGVCRGRVGRALEPDRTVPLQGCAGELRGHGQGHRLCRRRQCAGLSQQLRADGPQRGGCRCGPGRGLGVHGLLPDLGLRQLRARGRRRRAVRGGQQRQGLRSGSLSADRAGGRCLPSADQPGRCGVDRGGWLAAQEDGPGRHPRAGWGVPVHLLRRHGVRCVRRLQRGHVGPVEGHLGLAGGRQGGQGGAGSGVEGRGHGCEPRGGSGDRSQCPCTGRCPG